MTPSQTLRATPLCQPLSLTGVGDQGQQQASNLSNDAKRRLKNALQGQQVCWGMPFTIEQPLVVTNKALELTVASIKAPWLCFLHAAEPSPDPEIIWYEKTLAALKASNQPATSYLNTVAATYHIHYDDGSEAQVDIRYRHHINTAARRWGENTFEAVPHHAPFGFSHEDNVSWGFKQHLQYDGAPRSSDSFTHWIYAWPNPYPNKSIVGLRIEPGFGTVILSAITASYTEQTPIRWAARKKAVLTLPSDHKHEEPAGPFFSSVSDQSNYRLLSASRKQLIQIDMGTVISIVPRFSYNNRAWESVNVSNGGEPRNNEFIIEYAAHPQAKAYLNSGEVIALSDLELSDLEENKPCSTLRWIPPAQQSVVLRVIDQQTRQPVAVRLHIHGQSDEYLAPVNRHRMPSDEFFEDYGPELAGPNLHSSTYIDGETTLNLPLGPVYIEISKGFECKPIHKTVEISPDTSDIHIEIEKVLNWREKGWVTADTHVHFLSPATAHLEGMAEGIHVVNLLASQWGELMTNVGDFDGKTTFTNTEANQPYFVRVGTENRQAVLGHISLLGYQGSMITPLCTGGSLESAIGDPVEVLMTEWAQMCRDQGGLVVFPHFPQPQAEHAATIVSGLVDAVEMTNPNGGILPTSLVTWYRYLNLGYQIPLSGGTDKMAARMALGEIRTYSKLAANSALSYGAWQDSIRHGNTFVTVGPLLEFSVDGKEAGSRIEFGKTGGHVTVSWQVQTIKHQIIGVELIVNGEIVDGKQTQSSGGEGFFDISITRSAWVCLLVRGRLASDGEELILAHSSSVMIHVAGSEFFAAADAVSLLEQIEGSMAYLEHVGTRAETRRYQAMRLVLEQAHKKLHDRLHQLGFDHSHSIGHSHHKE